MIVNAAAVVGALKAVGDEEVCCWVEDGVGAGVGDAVGLLLTLDASGGWAKLVVTVPRQSGNRSHAAVRKMPFLRADLIWIPLGWLAPSNQF